MAAAAPPKHWQPDAEATACLACRQPFTMRRRRHHCRACGKIFCKACSARQRPVPHRGHREAVRVCDACDELEAGRAAFQREYSAMLRAGAEMTKIAAGRGGPKRRHVRLSEDGAQLRYGDKALPVAELQAVSSGHATDVFRRSGRPGTEDVCFSLVFRSRTLDLEAASREERDRWVRALGVLVALPAAGADDLERRREQQRRRDAEKQEVRERNADVLAQRRADRERKAAEMRERYGLS